MFITPAKVWQTTELDRYVAEELFGWKWVAFKGIPVNSHPDYPAEVIVRQFMTPNSLTDQRWLDHFAEIGGFTAATGDEPLSYRYCSSCGPACVPHFSGDLNECAAMEKELRRRKLWLRYVESLAVQCRAMRRDGTINTGKTLRASCQQRCIAALATVGSKYVTEG